MDDSRWGRFEERRVRFETNCERVRRAIVVVPGGAKIPAARALKQPEVRLNALVDSRQIALDVSGPQAALDLASVETEFKYEGYLRRQMVSVERLRRQEDRSIPQAFAFDTVPGLSREMIQRLSEVRPATLGQASRIPGVTPAAVAVVAAYIDRHLERAN